ncbi:hypothetical protein [Flavobacterium wongokense]|uniref:hypothetical protein n=1 Tax=Flavobacterium wongokense TaxID=2910674 RepID=UPI001F38B4CB|nr:hypothetical protein [Flavobacterium sp. WG47]MCF6132515.1 hypothetical protein [Flavobacterium sp. WG47]
MLKYILLWFPMIIIAVVNGSVRDLWYKNYLGELKAQQLSTIALILFLGSYINFVIKKYPPQSVSKSLIIGLIWMLLTLAFEFGFGLYRGNSWPQLLKAYNIMTGNIWILIPIGLFLAPYLLYTFPKK